MHNCPICSHCSSTERDNPTVPVLSEHVKREHQSCFVATNPARPWRCSLCHGRKPCFKTCETFAKHLLQVHWPGAAPRPQGALAPSTPAALTRPEGVVDPAQRSSNADYKLAVPCAPWFPRPRWWLRPPQATLLLASWNLEHFSPTAGDTEAAARKVGNICTTLRELVRQEGPAASVVVALQEVFDARGPALLAEHLTKKDKEGGSGRVWHAHTSEPLGNNPERSAFLWSGPPAQAAQAGLSALTLAWCGCGTDVVATGAGAGAGAAEDEGISGAVTGVAKPLGSTKTASAAAAGVAKSRGAQAPLFAAPPTSFQMLTEEDRQTVIRGAQDAVRDGCFMRSPFFGLFRVGYCNLLVANVHLAAQAQAARSEVSSLHLLASAIQRPNDRLFRRRFSRLGACLGGALLTASRRPRGLMAVVGDFNCPVGRAVPAVPAAQGPVAEAVEAADDAGTARRQQRRGAAGAVGDSGAAAGATGHTAAGGGDCGGGGGGGGSDRRIRNGAGGGNSDAANAASWEAFQRNGWVNVLAQRSHAEGGGGGGGGPIATNWYAKQPKALDAICLPRDQVLLPGARTRGSAAVVTGVGVCPPPAYVNAADGAEGKYPNHLLCWVRLDLGPLQRAPGKVRQLLAPARVALAETVTAAAAGGGGGG